MFKRQTANNGFLSQPLRSGEFTLSVYAKGFEAYNKVINHTQTDTVMVVMETSPIDFSVKIVDIESQKPVLAKVDVVGDKNTYHGLKTDSINGLVQGKLKKGIYTVTAVADGYLYVQKDNDFERSPQLTLELQTIKKDVKMVIENLFFELNSAVIMSESDQTIDKLSQFMAENPDIKIKIVGHTDNTGTTAFNKNLSLERAKSVREALVAKGIDLNRIIVDGKGSTESIDTNDTEEGRAKNRRVEFEIL